MSSGKLDFITVASGTVALETVAVHLNPVDEVAIAKIALPPGTKLTFDGGTITVRQFIGSGHKVALTSVQRDLPVRRYGQIIGFASQDISAGDHVHIHNIEVRDFARDYAFGTAVEPVSYVPENERLSFMGYRRANGRVGTRNMIAVISTV